MSLSQLAFFNWTDLHPLTMYFPIFLFLLAPVFLLSAIFTNSKNDSFVMAAFLAMFLGVTAMSVTVDAGQGTAAIVSNEDVQAIIEQHRKLASFAWDSFAMATLLLGVMFCLHQGFRVNFYNMTVVLPLGFVVFYALGLYWLIRAA
jgi:hypothetical protein